MLLFELILDDWTVEKGGERVKKLEFPNDGVAIIEALGQDGGDSPLKLLDSLFELVEVVLELSLFDIHDIVGNGGELGLGISELFEDLLDCLREGLTLGVTNFNLLEGRELDDGRSKVHDVLASL